MPSSRLPPRPAKRIWPGSAGTGFPTTRCPKAGPWVTNRFCVTPTARWTRKQFESASCRKAPKRTDPGINSALNGQAPRTICIQATVSSNRSVQNTLQTDREAAQIGPFIGTQCVAEQAIFGCAQHIYPGHDRKGLDQFELGNALNELGHVVIGGGHHDVSPVLMRAWCRRQARS